MIKKSFISNSLSIILMSLLSAVQLHADILVTSPEGDPRLVVEIKRSRYATRHLATGQSDRAVPPDCYLLVITPQEYWLTPPRADNASHKGATDALLERYIDTEKVLLSTLGDAEFASVVASWLGSIVFKPAHVLLTMPAQRWLVESGLHPEIARGHIRREAIYN